MALVTKELVTTEEVATRTGRLSVLRLTKSGKQVTDPPQTNAKTLRQGGATHEYWKHKYAEVYKKSGYQVTLEEPVGNGKTVDLVARKDHRTIAVEIETGKSHVLANVRKCLAADFDQLIVAATSKQTESKIRALLENASLRGHTGIKVECTQQMDQNS
jgi:hypothetical protein